ncbi:MAG: glycosyltransferase family 4 protein [Chloroflexota bacterium]|nr:glycosyltransferase family 4 protein [Chloroflexota bacterium]
MFRGRRQDELPFMRLTMLLRNPFTHDSRVEKEARSLTAAGYRVTVVADAAPGLPDAEERDGYSVLRVERPLRRVPIARFVAYRNRLLAAVLATRPQILHANDTDTLEPIGAAARRLRIPFVYDAHELWLGQPPRGRGPLYSAAFRAYYRPIESLLVPRAAAVLTVSPPIARNLARRYRLDEVHLVPNYPELQPLRRRDLRSLPGGAQIPADAPLLLHLGTIHAERGIAQLLSALAELPNVHLVLLGRDRDTSWVAGLVGELGLAGRVHVLDRVPPEQVVDLAASATIGVVSVIPDSLNSRYSLPNKLFQYLAAGLPVVATRLPQMQEVVEANGLGVNVDTRRPSEIAAGVRTILSAPGGPMAIGARARRAAEERYNWGTAETALVAAYRSVTGELPGSRTGGRSRP